MRLGRRSRDGRPTSLIAAYLFARVRDDGGESERLGSGTDGLDEFVAFVDAVFVLAVRRRFPEPLRSIRQISSTVDHARRVLGGRAPTLTIEALVRSELGEDVPTDDIGIEPGTLTKIAVFNAIVNDELHLPDDEILTLLAGAERVVAARGLNLQQRPN